METERHEDQVQQAADMPEPVFTEDALEPDREDLEKAMKMVRGNSMDYYKKTINAHPVLSHEETVALAKRYHETGDMQAKEKLVLHNLRFVFFVVRRYASHSASIPLDDLVQPGIMGLMRAVDLYDPARGKFITYAFWRIKQMINAELNVIRGTVRLPPNDYLLLRKVQKLRRDVRTDAGVLSDKEVAKRLGVSAEAVRRVSQMNQNSLSLDEMMYPNESGRRTRHETMPDTNGISPATRSLARQKFDAISRRLVSLYSALLGIEEHFPRKVEIFKAYYGLDGSMDERATLDSLGKRFGVGRERVRQINASIWRRLRHSYRDLDLDKDGFIQMFAQLKTIADILGIELDLARIFSQAKTRPLPARATGHSEKNNERKKKAKK